MARMTVGMRRVLWEIALTNERLPVSAVDERMLRYSTRADYGGGTEAMERLMTLGKVEEYDVGGVAMLRFAQSISASERERLVAAAVEAAVEAACACRSAYIAAGLGAEERLNAITAQMAEAFTGSPAPKVDYALGDKAAAEVKRMIAEHHNLAFVDRYVSLEQVAPEHRAKLAHLCAPTPL